MTEASKPMLRSGSESGDALTRLNALAPRGKYPDSTRILDGWVAKAQSQVGVDHGRLGWLVASTVVNAALQRAAAEDLALELVAGSFAGVAPDGGDEAVPLVACVLVMYDVMSHT